MNKQHQWVLRIQYEYNRNNQFFSPSDSFEPCCRLFIYFPFFSSICQKRNENIYIFELMMCDQTYNSYANFSVQHIHLIIHTDNIVVARHIVVTAKREKQKNKYVYIQCEYIKWFGYCLADNKWYFDEKRDSSMSPPTEYEPMKSSVRMSKVQTTFCWFVVFSFRSRSKANGF